MYREASYGRIKVAANLQGTLTRTSTVLEPLLVPRPQMLGEDLLWGASGLPKPPGGEYPFGQPRRGNRRLAFLVYCLSFLFPFCR